MSKTQLKLLEIIKSLGEVTKDEVLARGIPLSALDALVAKGFVYKPERLSESFKPTSAA
ncbi:hypothetical protein J1779_07845 [Rahnella sp. FC061912-K]|uniref:hypothetical protein n=1 Tax=Rahnella rivi TaxID=2816249 RepID=UPI001C28026C|nr:hypothetical protein [Rahnella rivi]MBU9829842.1 hypothetical protein [Rahnella rivi]